MTEENNYLNPHQAAVLLGLSAKTLARYRVPGRRLQRPHPFRRPLQGYKAIGHAVSNGHRANSEAGPIRATDGTTDGAGR